MRGFINEQAGENNNTLSLSRKKLPEVVINNFSSKTSIDKTENNYPIEQLELENELMNKKNTIISLEKEIVNLQNTILILENDLEVNILQNIETIIKQEEFLLEMNQIISSLNMKNENYQNMIVKKNKEIKILANKYKKLKLSKMGSLVLGYWNVRKKILKSR